MSEAAEYKKRYEEASRELEAARTELAGYEGLLKLAMDDMRRIYDDLMRSQSQILQADKLSALGFLAAGVAHEINNPLSAILGTAFILKEELRGVPAGERREKMIEFVADLEKCAGTIASIVKQVRTFSRADRGESVETDLHAVLDGVLPIAGYQAKHRVELKKEYGSPPRVRANAQQLGQVFLNLIVNAIQAIDGRGIVTIRTRERGGKAEVEIQDTGCGVPPELREKIFESFFTTKDAEQGTGLGLGISRDLVRKNGGQIEVESEPGRGSTFRVKFPGLGA